MAWGTAAAPPRSQERHERSGDREAILDRHLSGRDMTQRSDADAGEVVDGLLANQSLQAVEGALAMVQRYADAGNWAAAGRWIDRAVTIGHRTSDSERAATAHRLYDLVSQWSWPPRRGSENSAFALCLAARECADPHDAIVPKILRRLADLSFPNDRSAGDGAAAVAEMMKWYENHGIVPPVETMAHAASTLVTLGDKLTGLEWARRAIAALGAESGPLKRVRHLSTLASVYGQCGHWEDACDMHFEVRSTHKRLPSPYDNRALDVLDAVALAEALFHLGRFEEAWRVLEEEIEAVPHVPEAIQIEYWVSYDHGRMPSSGASEGARVLMALVDEVPDRAAHVAHMKWRLSTAPGLVTDASV